MAQVAQNSDCADTFARVECIYYENLFTNIYKQYCCIYFFHECNSSLDSAAFAFNETRKVIILCTGLCHIPLSYLVTRKIVSCEVMCCISLGNMVS